MRVGRQWRWPLGTLAAMTVLVFPAVAPATSCVVCFTGGPSVRVTPDAQLEFKWTTDVSWFGKVEVFTNPDGTGISVAARQALDMNGVALASSQQDVTLPVAAPLAADTTYYFRVTATDPSNNLPDISTPTPLPSFFTGVQALSNVRVTPGTATAQISWQGNVIGFGQVQSGLTTAYTQTQTDAINVTGHSFTLTGLQPATTYFFRVCNLHAIDGDCLASSTGSFTTLAATCGIAFCSGPSARVTPDTQVEFKWVTGVAWFGKVEVFDNPSGTGTPITTTRGVDTGGQPVAVQTLDITIPIGPALAADTTYYFRVTATDPTGTFPDIVTATPLPLFFTGAQALSNVRVTPGTTTAQVSWQGNVIGFGQVQYGLTTAYTQTQTDAMNVTGHSFTLTGLQPATTYDFQVCNLHAIDGDCLASSTGSFTTLGTLTDQFLSPLLQSTDPASSQINTGKNGKVIPVKVQISQGGTAITITNAPGPVTIAVSKFACGTSAGTDPVSSYADAGQSSAGTNQFNYDATAQAWVYGLDTKALGLVTGNCYRIDVAVNGTQISNAFAVYQPTK